MAEKDTLLTDELGATHSNYTAFRDGRLVLLLEDEKPAARLAQFVHNQLRALILDTNYPCVGARAAFNQGAYRFSMYLDMASPEATAGLCVDLRAFVAEQPRMDSPFTTFVASFTGPHPKDWKQFNFRVCRQLQALHDVDPHECNPSTCPDPEDLRASFRFAEQAFFLIGFHAASTRWSRRFAWPTLVFNARHQFERLHEENKLERFQQIIRTRDRALQGSIDPTLLGPKQHGS